jgi:drug/metabolite transporter (DMT)-like permease
VDDGSALRNAPLPSASSARDGYAIGGVVLMAMGVLRGEILIRPEDFSAASLLALAYLIVFGSWVGFTAYVWLLRNALPRSCRRTRS